MTGWEFEWDVHGVLDGLLMVLNGIWLYGMFLVGSIGIPL